MVRTCGGVNLRQSETVKFLLESADPRRTPIPFTLVGSANLGDITNNTKGFQLTLSANRR